MQGLVPQHDLEDVRMKREQRALMMRGEKTSWLRKSDTFKTPEDMGNKENYIVAYASSLTREIC